MENSNSTNSFLQFNDNQSNNNSTNQQQFQYSTSPTFNTLSPTSSTSSSSLLESTSLSLPFSPQYYYHQQQQHRDQLPSLLPPALTYSNQPQTRSEPSEREAVEFTSHRITATTDWRRSNFNYNSGIYISPTTVHLPPISPPPVPRTTLPLHRVYILNCSTCDTFLSDRGMRVSFCSFSLESLVVFYYLSLYYPFEPILISSLTHSLLSHFFPLRLPSFDWNIILGSIIIKTSHNFIFNRYFSFQFRSSTIQY